MGKALSVGSVIDKNKITSDVAWVVLLEVDVVDPNSRTVVETLCIAKNNEAITFNGQVYQPGNFEFEFQQRQNETPQVSIAAQDQTRYIHQRMEEMAGGVFSTVLVRVVNSNRLDRPAEIEERFQITESSVKDYVVNFGLGTENPLTLQFPKHTQRQDRCAWRYKGYGCGYSGGMPKCDYTRDGANGCRAHNNYANFRAEPGLVRMNM